MANLKLTWEQVFPKGAILGGVRPWQEYADGKRTGKQLGLAYTLVNRTGYDKVTVKIASTNPIMTNEEIENADDDILVIAEGFEGIVYNRDGAIAISGRAERLVLA